MGTFLSGSAQYPLRFVIMQGCTPQRVGRFKGKLGEGTTAFHWEFLYDISWAPEDQLAHTVIWEWRFRVYDARGVQVYQAAADSLPLLRELSGLRHIKEQVAYQAQLFLEEYLHERLDLGSGRYRKPPQAQ